MITEEFKSPYTVVYIMIIVGFLFRNLLPSVFIYIRIIVRPSYPFASKHTWTDDLVSSQHDIILLPLACDCEYPNPRLRKSNDHTHENLLCVWLYYSHLKISPDFLKYHAVKSRSDSWVPEDRTDNTTFHPHPQVSRPSWLHSVFL